MRKKKVAAVFGSVLLSASILTPAAAAPGNGNYAPGTPSEQHYSISGFIDHKELSKKLQQMERSSNGKVDVNVAGHSNQGREIYTARVGTGDKVVLIQSEIHGNEKRVQPHY